MEFIEEYNGVTIYRSRVTGFFKTNINGGDISSIEFLRKLIDISNNKK